MSWMTTCRFEQPFSDCSRWPATGSSLIHRHSNYWISARYVRNVGYVDYCKNVRPSAMNDSDKAREAMG